MTARPTLWSPPRRTARLAAYALLLGLTLAASAVCASARAAEPGTPADQTVRSTIDDVFTILRDGALRGPEKRGERMAKLRSLADTVFDWAEMSKRSLGVHWRSITEAQRTRFVTVFADLLADHYMNDFDRFRGTEKVSVDGTEAMGDDQVVKTTFTTHSGENIPINYVVRLVDGKWRCYDVSIEGVSLVNHYRKGFTRQLTNRTFDELLEQLSRKQQSLRPPKDETAD